jgi:hypothetical protein
VAAELNKDAIAGRWVHAHEEDTDDGMVFRPASQPMPPARGRTALELRPDGTYTETSPGPTDAPEDSDGTWALEGDRLILGAEGARAGHAWRVVSAGTDRLTVRA